MINRRLLLMVTMLFGVAGLSPGNMVTARELPYFLRGSGLLQSTSGGDFFDFGNSGGYSVGAGLRVGSYWELGLEYDRFILSNNEGTDSTARLFGFNNNVGADFEVNRLGLSVSRLIFPTKNKLNLLLGATGGVIIWEMVEQIGDTALNVSSDRNATVDFSANELFFGGKAGLRWAATEHFSLDLVARADYLSGAGAEFADIVNNARDRWLIGSSLSLSIFFGSKEEPPDWSKIRQESGSFAQPLILGSGARDSDGDGVPDRVDRCRNSPAGVLVDRFGCPLDSDRDGVYDGLDDCPDTDPAAAGTVDIHGCPVDGDFDGIPDYLDACPNNPIGAMVDSVGCPVDSDGDGVPDGLDDCPHTLAGMEVDKQGCIDLAMLGKPMILNIDYVSGAFEIDPHNQKRLKRLAGLLTFVPDYKIEINGYTDDVGSAAANRKLAQKRANRVRDFLVNFGVAAERIKVFGQGETNFVASNQTSQGRSLNRRIEIVFFK